MELCLSKEMFTVKENPSLPTLKILSNALGISVNELGAFDDQVNVYYERKRPTFS